MVTRKGQTRIVQCNAERLMLTKSHGGEWPEKWSPPGHRIKIHTEGPLTSEALKFLSSRMSHYACWPPFSQPVQ